MTFEIEPDQGILQVVGSDRKIVLLLESVPRQSMHCTQLEIHTDAAAEKRRL